MDTNSGVSGVVISSKSKALFALVDSRDVKTVLRCTRGFGSCTTRHDRKKLNNLIMF